MEGVWSLAMLHCVLHITFFPLLCPMNVTVLKTVEYVGKTFLVDLNNFYNLEISLDNFKPLH